MARRRNFNKIFLRKKLQAQGESDGVCAHFVHIRAQINK